MRRTPSWGDGWWTVGEVEVEEDLVIDGEPTGEPVVLRPAEGLEALFRAAGVERGDTVVAYCRIGQYATTALLAARTLGHEVRLYDGSTNEWAILDLPVEAGGARP